MARIYVKWKKIKVIFKVKSKEILKEKFKVIYMNASIIRVKNIDIATKCIQTHVTCN